MSAVRSNSGPPTPQSAGGKPSIKPPRELWLHGGVLACACPDCGAPMSVRVWLMMADCLHCGASIELTPEEQRRAEQLLAGNLKGRAAHAVGCATAQSNRSRSDAHSTAAGISARAAGDRNQRFRRRSKPSRTSPSPSWSKRARRFRPRFRLNRPRCQRVGRRPRLGICAARFGRFSWHFSASPEQATPFGRCCGVVARRQSPMLPVRSQPRKNHLCRLLGGKSAKPRKSAAVRRRWTLRLNEPLMNLRFRATPRPGCSIFPKSSRQ